MYKENSLHRENSHTLTNHPFCSYSDNLNRRFARVTNQEKPLNGGQYWPFPSTSATFYRLAELQSLPAGPADPQPIHDPLRTQSPQSSGANDVEVLATANTKTKKPRVKSADWTEKETNELLEAWAPKIQ